MTSEQPESLPNSEPHSYRIQQSDWLIAALLAVTGGWAYYYLANLFPPTLLSTMDFWFEADTVREVSNMTSFDDDHYRTSVHPLISLVTFGPVYVVRHLFSLNPLEAVRIVTSAMGGLWIGVLFVMLRLIGCRIIDASVFTLVGLSSASALFWIALPNSYTYGSLSIMFALCLLLLAERRAFGAIAYVLVSALTLSMTLTNWMAGLLVTFAKWPWRKALQLSVNAFCLVVVLWGVQKVLFPTAEFFLGSIREASFVGHAQTGGPRQVAQSFFFHSFVAPHIRLIDDDGYVLVGDDSLRLSQRLTFQFSAPGSAGPSGAFAAVAWAMLLLAGGWHLVRGTTLPRFRVVLGALIAFQFGLHVVYGEETFVYSLHYSPLLLSVAALGTRGRTRLPVLLVAGLLVVCGAHNNWTQFTRAVERSKFFTPQRDIMVQAMRRDPNRPWPRHAGHVVLGIPGMPETERAYHEPGGDFSPQTPSFGVSFWLCDASGRPILTSQTLPLSDIQQWFEPSSNPDVPDIVTKTPYYEVRWSQLDAKRWHLRFRNLTPHVPAILIRGVGPAGGPITSLTWDGEFLRINEQWVAEVNPPPAQVALGDETAPGWMTEPPSGSVGVSDMGWGYARLVLTMDPSKLRDEFQMILSNVRIPINFGRKFRSIPAVIHSSLPDERFAASMEAQRAHLMMGLVGSETRPGDPVHFYRAWNQPGSYVVAALARAGNPHTSRVLSKTLATQDFLGGDGAEADEPGLTLWALNEAAKYIADADHDRWLWPHIKRKVSHIEQMLEARTPLVKALFVPSLYGHKHGQQTFESLLAKPSQNGLIIGRVGDEWPVLYVNALSYRGLVAAAEIADRVGARGDAARWRQRAEILQQHWQARFMTSAVDRKAYTVGLWPADIATPIRSLFNWRLGISSASLQEDDVVADVARAHQYLLLGQLDAVWRALERLWRHQASPGLYTWETELPRHARGAVDGWRFIRGWRNASVSPDYEIAAQLLLLQQDMLAYWDEAGPQPSLVLGGGVPLSWLSHPMSVSHLPIPGGEVSWQWDGRRMYVWVSGPSPAVRLGPAFPQDAKISISDHPEQADRALAYSPSDPDPLGSPAVGP